MAKFRCECGSYFRDDEIAMYALGASQAESVADQLPKVIADGHDADEAFLGALNLVFDSLHACSACRRLHLVRHGRHLATWQHEWTADGIRID